MKPPGPVSPPEDALPSPPNQTPSQVHRRAIMEVQQLRNARRSSKKKKNGKKAKPTWVAWVCGPTPPPAELFPDPATINSGWDALKDFLRNENLPALGSVSDKTAMQLLTKTSMRWLQHLRLAETDDAETDDDAETGDDAEKDEEFEEQEDQVDTGESEDDSGEVVAEAAFDQKRKRAAGSDKDAEASRQSRIA